MALTKEDLQAIREVVRAETDPINQRLDTLQKDVSHIKEQVDIAYAWVDRIDLRVKALEHE